MILLLLICYLRVVSLSVHHQANYQANHKYGFKTLHSTSTNRYDQGPGLFFLFTYFSRVLVRLLLSPISADPSEENISLVYDWLVG